MSDITLEQAWAAIDRALKKSQEIGAKMNIAVVDAGANLKAFARMDEAWLGSIDIAITKARTARCFDRDTGEIAKLSQPGGWKAPLSFYNTEHIVTGFVTAPGGVPIKNAAAEIIGAIGVSGDNAETAHLVATTGAKAAVGS